GELGRREQEVLAYLRAHLDFSATGADRCALELGMLAIVQHTDGAYARVPLRVDCGPNARAARIDYRLFFDLDAQHRCLVRVEQPGGGRSFVLAPDSGPTELELAGASGGLLHTLGAFVIEGIVHCLQGLDHVLFLLVMLLPVALRRQGGVWLAAES